MELVRFALLEIGMVYFVTMSAIFSLPRRALARVPFVAGLIYCPSCTGFWIGAALAFAGFGPFAIHDVVQDVACCAFAGMAISNCWHHALYQGGNDAFADEQLTATVVAAPAQMQEAPRAPE